MTVATAAAVTVVGDRGDAAAVTVAATVPPVAAGVRDSDPDRG